MPELPASIEYPPLEKPPFLKEWPKDFGREEAEKMAGQLIQSIPGCRVVRESSKYDDQKKGFDRIIELVNGSRVAVDITSTTELERQKKKIEKVFKTPFVQEHNNKGEVIDQTKMPLILFAFNKSKWGQAYNEFLEGKGKNPLDNLNQKKYQLNFLFQAIKCLEIQKYYHPKFEEIYQPALEVLTKEYEQLKNE